MKDPAQQSISCSLQLNPIETAVEEQGPNCPCHSESDCADLEALENDSSDENGVEDGNDDDTDGESGEDRSIGDRGIFDVEQLREELKEEITAELETVLYDRIYNDLLEQLRAELEL